ncbi:Bifunctional protein GlmU [bioreactor metagenome]|uniref:UDP-N-acetylglucosamine diphosphorylase n=1 Tax=bioreactor metagenome TaxID=1076179 RepID=A0A645F4Q7_9ZZZZ
MYNCAIILAAGEGKRMKSSLPKVLHKVCGKEMVNHVIDTLKEAEVDDINVIVGKGADEVKNDTSSRKVSYSFQDKQLGTGHAVKCAKDFLKGKEGTVAIFTGDAPLITSNTIKNLISFHEKDQYKATILTSIVSDPTGYGRIIREENEEVGKIVEHKDCNDEELKVNEINAGMYCFDIHELLGSLELLSNNNSQGEYYLTDVIEILKSKGFKVGALPVEFARPLWSP